MALFTLNGEIIINTGKAVEEMDKVKAKEKEVATESEKTEKVTSSFGSKLGNLGRAVAGFASSTAIVSFFKGCVSSAEKAATANAKFETVLKSASHATNEQIKSLQSYNKELQNVGVIGAGLNRTAETQLATFGLQTDSIKTLIPQLDNLAVNQKGVNATSEDMMGYANMVGKAMQGQATALTRVGVTMTDAQKKTLQNGNEQQRAATIAEVLKQNYGNLNEEIAKTPEGKAKKLENEMAGLKVQIGNMLLPVVETLTNALQKLFDWWNSLSSGTQKAIMIIGTVVGVMALVASAITSVTGVLSALGIAVNMAFAPWAILIAGVVAAVMILWNKCSWFRDGVIGVFNFIKNGFNKLVSALKIGWDNIKKAASAVIDFIKGIWDGLCSTLGTVFNAFVVAFKFSWEIIKTVFNVVVGFIKQVWGGFCDYINSKFGPAIAAIRILWDKLKTKVVEIVESIKEKWQIFCELIKAFFGPIIEWIVSKWQWLKETVGGIIDTIKEKWNNFCDGIESFFGPKIEWVKEKWQWLKDGINWIVDSIKEKWNNFCDGVKEKWDGIVDWIKGAGEKLASPFIWLKDKIAGIWDSIRSSIKLPHFSMSGEFSLDPPSIPSISVDWYSTGALFSKPTLLGGIGVGDKDNGTGNQTEAVMRYKDLMSIVNKALNRPIEISIDGRECMKALAPHQQELFNYGIGR